MKTLRISVISKRQLAASLMLAELPLAVIADAMACIDWRSFEAVEREHRVEIRPKTNPGRMTLQRESEG